MFIYDDFLEAILVNNTIITVKECIEEGIGMDLNLALAIETHCNDFANIDKLDEIYRDILSQSDIDELKKIMTFLY